MQFATPQIRTADDTNGVGLHRPDLGVWPGLVRDSSSSRRTSIADDVDEAFESQLGWSDLVTVCLAGAAGWAVLIAVGWYVVDAVGLLRWSSCARAS